MSDKMPCYDVPKTARFHRVCLPESVLSSSRPLRPAGLPRPATTAVAVEDEELAPVPLPPRLLVTIWVRPIGVIQESVRFDLVW